MLLHISSDRADYVPVSAKGILPTETHWRFKGDAARPDDNGLKEISGEAVKGRERGSRGREGRAEAEA